MLAAQRLDKMRKIFLEKEVVELSYLAEHLNVSEITIRRDFEKLEKEGFIKKQYGGAILNKSIVSTRDVFDYDAEESREEMNLIGKIAEKIIEDGDSIYLGGGLGSRFIARNIDEKKNIFLLTNDILVASELWNNYRTKVAVTGGEMVVGTGLLFGKRAIDTLQNVHINKAFIDVNGVSPEKGFSVKSFEASDFFSTVMELADESIALINHNCFDKFSYTKLCEINAFERVVTNKEVDDKYKKVLFDIGTKLYTTFDVK